MATPEEKVAAVLAIMEDAEDRDDAEATARARKLVEAVEALKPDQTPQLDAIQAALTELEARVAALEQAAPSGPTEPGAGLVAILQTQVPELKDRIVAHQSAGRQLAQDILAADPTSIE